MNNTDNTTKYRVTIALGRPDHTWVEKDVIIELPDGDDEDDYPWHERAFDKLNATEPEYLDKIAPSFWTTLHYERLDEV